MDLQYLDFEINQDDQGNASFDAMAAVAPENLAELRNEILEILAWAQQRFGAPRPLEDGGEWDCELQAAQEISTPMKIDLDVSARRLDLAPVGVGMPRTSLSITLSGTPEFGFALRQAFGLDNWVSR